MDTKVPAVLEKKVNAATESIDEPVRIVAMIGEGAVSPLKSATWEEVMRHTVSRLFFQIFYKFSAFEENEFSFCLVKLCYAPSFIPVKFK